MSSLYLPFHPNPARPRFQLPVGAVDVHCHVFGPAKRFPFSDQRKYTPCDADKETLFRLRQHLGLTRNVIVQATCHGTDNRALLDALQAGGDTTRGVVSLDSGVTDAELLVMHKAGVRGVRFNFVRRLVDDTPRSTFIDIADRIRPLGWHVVVYFEAADFDGLRDFLLELNMPVVIDHMGRPDIEKGIESPEFQAFMAFMETHSQIWTKVSCPERLSISGPPDYRDVVPFSRTLVQRFSDRVLWGTDWPHPNMRSHMPDEGDLVDLIPEIAPTASLQRALLIDNPMRLYWDEA